MAYTVKNLGQAQIPSATVATLYTVPVATSTLVKDIMITNTTVNEVTITIWLDPSGIGATDADALIKNFTVPANDFIHWYGFKVMATGSTIKAQSDTNNALTVTVDGVEIT